MKQLTLIFIASLLLIALFSFPDTIAKLTEPDDYFYYRVDSDINVYYTYIDQAKEGRFLFCNQYAVENHECRLLFPIWSLTGLLENIFNIEHHSSFIIIRIIALLFLMTVVYKIIQLFTKKDQLIYFLSAFLSGGTFIYILHSNFFIASLRNPQNVVVAGMLGLIFFYSIKYLIKNKKIFLFNIFLCANILILIHPYEIFLLIINYSLLLIFSTYEWPLFFKSLKIFFTIAVASFFSGLYYVYIFTSSKAYSGWLINNYLPFKSYYEIYSTFGYLLIFSFISVYLLYKKYGKTIEKKWLIVFSWFFGGFIVIFMPLYINIKLVLGWHFSLFILCAFLISFLKNLNWPFWCRQTIIFLLIGNLFIGNYLFFSYEIKDILYKNYPRYVPKNYIDSLEWLNKNSALDDVILASFRWDTFISAYGGLKSFIGSNQAYNQHQKSVLSEWFYKNNDYDQEKIAFLKNHGIDFVYFSTAENEIGDFMPLEKNYLENIYNFDRVQIYKVTIVGEE